MRNRATATDRRPGTPAHPARNRPLDLLLINPRNPLVKLTDRSNRWNKYRVWKPLGLLVLAGITPPGWRITVIDENVDIPDYSNLPRPDLVGVTAFTSQAPRAYEIAAMFRDQGIPVVMGGIHASMCPEEARTHVDAIVTGEAESVWARVLDDAMDGQLKPLYAGGQVTLEKTLPARHDLLPSGYHFGSIQTSRGCPLNCSFCSVSAFNGKVYRRRAIEDIVAEMKLIREEHVLIVDDNLIGTRRDHVARAKDLFRAMIAANLGKKWICQATINMADDEELLNLARKAGCTGVFVGFETTTDEGLVEIQKKYHLRRGRDFKAAVRQIQKHKICVAGSFIIGLDVDRPGVGRRITETAKRYGIDVLNVLFLTPLPGTDLWRSMVEEKRIPAGRFPEDWKYYTLTFPVGRYRHLDRAQAIDEMNTCIGGFYSLSGILQRVGRNLLKRQQPWLVLVANLSFRKNSRLNRNLYRELRGACDRLLPKSLPIETGDNLHTLAPGLRTIE
jgi:radical SAM superfamily enzyme YgiQ (UPF0313 family)